MPDLDQVGGLQTGLTVFIIFQWIWIYTFNKNATNFVTMYSASSYYFSCEGETRGSAQVFDGFKLS